MAQTFNEQEWIKQIMIINDVYRWCEEQGLNVFYKLPVDEKRKFRHQNYFLTVQVVAHILETHFIENSKVPLKSKFTCSVVELFTHIRDAWNIEALAVPDSTKSYRIVAPGKEIGTKDGKPVEKFTILTNADGKILTAFPGFLTFKELTDLKESNIAK